MKDLVRSARFLALDMASTLALLIVLLVTHGQGVRLGVGVGMAVGIGQFLWSVIRRQPIHAMLWLSVILVVVSGVATLLTHDPRFVMAKPSLIYVAVGATMLKRGWMNRYLPEIAQEIVPDVAETFGYVWAGLMFASAGLNLALALVLDPLAWSTAMSVWAVASKVALFLAQFGVMRFIGLRRHRAQTAAAAA